MNDEEKISDEDKTAYANIRGSLAELCRQQKLELEQQNESIIPEEIEKELETESKEKVLWRKYIRRFSIVVISFLVVGGAVAFGINKGLIYNSFEKNTEIKRADHQKQKQEELKVYEPDYILEGFYETDRISDETICTIIYENENSSTVELIQQINAVYNSDLENIYSEHVDVNGLEGYYYIEEEDSVLIWSSNQILFILQGIPQIPQEEMVKIAESINTKESE